MKSFKKMIALLLSLVLLLGCTYAFAEGSKQVSVRYEGEGFDSPEAALTCYMEGFKNLDFEQVMSAFAWETQMEHYDFRAYFERLGVYNTSTKPGMPSANSLLFSANVNILRSNQANMIYQSIEQYILGDSSPSKAATGAIVFRKDSDDLDVFLQKFETGRLDNLAQMTNIRFMSPDDITNGMFSSGKSPERFAKMSAAYGADETVNLIGMADVGDETFFCCPTICRYGDKWYLVSVNSFTGTLVGLTPEYMAFACVSGGLGSPVN